MKSLASKLTPLLAISLVLFPIIPSSSMAQSTAAAAEKTLPVAICKQVGNNTPSAQFRYEDAGHITDWSRILRPIGNQKMVVIPLDFSDAPEQKKSLAQLTFLDEVSEFMERNSQGKLGLEIEVLDNWVRLPKTARYYADAIWTEKINDAIDEVDPYIDFSDYELTLFYISKTNMITVATGALPGWDLRYPDGQTVRGAFLGNDGWRQLGQDATVTIHELMHVYGLPDLYMANKDGSKNVGVFDLMSEYLEDVGPRLFDWHRWKLGWLDDDQIECLNPLVKHELVIKKSDAQKKLWVMPMSDTTVKVFQPWMTGSKFSVISYSVDTKDYVWHSGGPKGSGFSAIQMLRPNRSPISPGGFMNRNLTVVLKNGDVITDKSSVLRAGVSKNSVRLKYESGTTSLETMKFKTCKEMWRFFPGGVSRIESTDNQKLEPNLSIQAWRLNERLRQPGQEVICGR
ncbi:hypothetical protein [Candidatus Aquiluna sp. UB-MaderosW2red]|uniref:hypothetical protein n=1 Tax=Candidatus Aquiluna sp. UB-MaderosW2red TaxID=1855377 RepID=UPI000875AF6A|nr:hypothetical protein [Candidatus Aquiluna sp. UB-MaderosW2red]SCX09943.1 M6 family metalloprotease domain-containing protein [Candidatus Aquiluna sp. UB-MaderosW2red]